MDRISTFSNRLALFGAYLAGALLVAMIGHILVEIVLRSFFAASTYVLDEFVGYGVAAMTFLAAGHTLRSGVFIRVNIVLDRLPAEGGLRRGMEVFCAVVTLLAIALLVQFFWISVSRHYTRGSVSETIAEVPLWIPEGLVLIGLGILCIQLLTYAVELIAARPLIEGEAAE